MPGSGAARFTVAPVTRHREVSRTGALVARVVAACAVTLAVVAVAPAGGSGGFTTTSTTCSRPPRSRWRSRSGWWGRARRARGRLPDGVAGDRDRRWWPASTRIATSYAAYELGGDSGAALPPGPTLALAAAWVSSWAGSRPRCCWRRCTRRCCRTAGRCRRAGGCPLASPRAAWSWACSTTPRSPGPLGTFTALDNPIAWAGAARRDRAASGAHCPSCWSAWCCVSLVSLVVRFRRAEGAGAVAGRLVRVRRGGGRTAGSGDVAGPDPRRR